MTIAAQITDIHPVYSPLRELLRATFHLAGIKDTFVAFSADAQAVVSADSQHKEIAIAASSRVTLLNKEQAFLVDTAQPVAY
jgi:hypothetical protein